MYKHDIKHNHSYQFNSGFYEGNSSNTHEVFECVKCERFWDLSTKTIYGVDAISKHNSEWNLTFLKCEISDSEYKMKELLK